MNFPTTHWSLLAKASLSGNADGQRALEELCRRYWMPVHQFIRFRNISGTEAQDLTQEFMVHLLEKSAFARADRLRGRFRSFLLAALVRFLSDQSDKRLAQKRGGTVPHVSFDADGSAAGGEFDPASVDNRALFDREWAVTLMEAALGRVAGEYSEAGREPLFDVLKGFLPGGTDAPSYEEAAGRAGLSIPALKSEIHRLRRRFRALVREEVAQTVSAPEEISSEMIYLQEVLMDRGNDFNPTRKLGVLDS